jgi:hypothetical protein
VKCCDYCSGPFGLSRRKYRWKIFCCAYCEAWYFYTREFIVNRPRLAWGSFRPGDDPG